ncbi:DMT family transporter [Microvirga makkahensis]|uniref:EamA family transporter n=1 Tax=Microvirga makkahensis TaxID=1128670 RepID=A0A7X3MSA0_9HYPH|nr:DMT family transporter [Microvirga makkahensis]MXQ12284.1 EamA family transporter [Microvirga makkahensis]
MAFFALGTSFCIALATLISAEVVKAVGGPMALSRWRMLIGFLMLALIATAVGGWGSLSAGHLPLIVLSSLVAIVVADPALNAGIALIGARRTGLIFSLSAPFAAGLGFLVLGETLGPSQLVGCALVAGGIAFAVGFSRKPAASGTGSDRNASIHAEVRLSAAGVLLAVLAAFGQAVGILSMRPVMLDNPDPFAVMAARGLVAVIVLWAWHLAFPGTWKTGITVPDWKTLARVSLGVFIGYVVGMSMLMIALTGTSVAVASTLSSMAPVAILPMLWLRTGTRLAWQAWCGAFVTVLGTAVLFWR